MFEAYAKLVQYPDIEQTRVQIIYRQRAAFGLSKRCQKSVFKVQNLQKPK